MKVHSPRGLPFLLSPDDAIARIRGKYNSRWFGAAQEFLYLHPPSAEFLPFYYCQGNIKGSFRGIVSYSTTTQDSKGNLQSGSSQTTTMPQPINSIFEPNRTQIYAGYKYNIHHVHKALRNEENPLHLRPMNLVDTSNATINLFEQSTTTLNVFVKEEVTRQAEETARALIRSYHPSASTISVEFNKLKIQLEHVIPVFVPCYVVKAEYDTQMYTLYVSGINGNVSGPFLINTLYVGRLAAVSSVALCLLLSSSIGTGLIAGSLLSVPVYYAAFYAAKKFPSWRRDYSRLQREKLRLMHENKDKSGFRPSVDSQRIQEEYQRSSYWDTHAYQTRKEFRDTPSDPRGYYKILGLTGKESVNEIRSAYRKLVLTEHPDAGGSTERMVKLSEAYRVLRDPKQREAYDRNG
ncbi:DnaJ chaperone protein [Trypanosoma theileri]|uniref:DnaJ chaperone protein n=1 Tax=Trypanosoma theileri TaxID=67003 RepID=A0A1X0NVK2_9TRYP|nr:DnaJ chaperone protein [Trypanosoma theileri]ORC88702.1 DnaJ chaperone protein [Trypanosoma theileri]